MSPSYKNTSDVPNMTPPAPCTFKTDMQPWHPQTWHPDARLVQHKKLRCTNIQRVNRGPTQPWIPIWFGLKCSPKKKKTGFLCEGFLKWWVSPQIIHLAIGFSIIFTIHFGVSPFKETPMRFFPLRSNPSFPLQLSDPHIMDHPWIRSGASFKGTVSAAGAGAMAFSRRWLVARRQEGLDTKIWPGCEDMDNWRKYRSPWRLRAGFHNSLEVWNMIIFLSFKWVICRFRPFIFHSVEFCGKKQLELEF